MAGIVGLLSVALGSVLACAARRFPVHVEALEMGAGLLLIGGMALASCALPVLL
jgi:hypothetical protein